MDKFGIFKLFSSFFDLLNKNNPKSQNENSFEQTDNALLGIENFFNAIKNKNTASSPNNSSFTNPTRTDSSPTNSQTKTDSFGDKNKNLQSSVTTQKPPLNYQMLSTIRSHDEIVKRVKEKNKFL